MTAGLVEFGKSNVLIKTRLREQVEDVDLIHEGRYEGI